MTLLHAGLLGAGLAAAAIPILIHLLFRRRRPPIQWAAMDILLAALRKQERRLRLEQIVLLATRCLLFALAGLALARPVLEGTGLLARGGGRVVTVVLDDGVASRVRAEPGSDRSSAFARLRSDAASLIRSLEPGDAVGVVLASRPVRGLVVPPSTDREAVARAVEALEPSHAPSDFAAALGVAGDAMRERMEADHVLVVLSEFRSGSFDPTRPTPTAVTAGERVPQVVLSTPAPDDTPTTAIASIETQRSIDDDSVTILVRVVRAGGSNPVQSVRVAVAGEGFSPIPAKMARFEAGQAATAIEFLARPAAQSPIVGAGAITASIEPDAMPADDSRFAWFDPRGATRIGVVTRRGLAMGGDIEQVPASRWLLRALAPTTQPGVEVAEIEPATVDARTLRDLDALIVPRPETLPPLAWPALRGFVDGGGLLVLMPSADTDAQRWTDAFAGAFGLPWQLASDAPALAEPVAFAAEQPSSASTDLFASIAAELPDLLKPVEFSRRIDVRGTAMSDVVLALADGTPFLLAASPAGSQGVGRGLVVLATAAPELAWTNLPVKPFMVPFVQEVVRRGLAHIGGADQAFVAEQPHVRVRDAAELAGPNAERVALEGGKSTRPLLTPGAWVANDLAGRPAGGIAVNVDLAGTRMAPNSADVVSAWFAPIGSVRISPSESVAEALAPAEDSVGVAVWLLAAVALLALLETFLARAFSHASAGTLSTSDPGVSASSLFGARRSAA